jgi:hypothetical protein
MSTAHMKVFMTYGNDTSHDNRNNVFHHKVRTKDGHRRDTDTRLCSSITAHRRASVIAITETALGNPQATYLAPIPSSSIILQYSILCFVIRCDSHVKTMAAVQPYQYIVSNEAMLQKTCIIPWHQRRVRIQDKGQTL